MTNFLNYPVSFANNMLRPPNQFCSFSFSCFHLHKRAFYDNRRITGSSSAYYQATMDYSYLNQAAGFDPAMTSAMADASNSFYGDLGSATSSPMMTAASPYGRYHSAAVAMRSAYSSVQPGISSPTQCGGLISNSGSSRSSHGSIVQDHHQRAAVVSAAASMFVGTGLNGKMPFYKIYNLKMLPWPSNAIKLRRR